jgi:hypothetical protein
MQTPRLPILRSSPDSTPQFPWLSTVTAAAVLRRRAGLSGECTGVHFKWGSAASSQTAPRGLLHDLDQSPGPSRGRGLRPRLPGVGTLPRPRPRFIGDQAADSAPPGDSLIKNPPFSKTIHEILAEFRWRREGAPGLGWRHNCISGVACRACPIIGHICASGESLEAATRVCRGRYPE